MYVVIGYFNTKKTERIMRILALLLTIILFNNCIELDDYRGLTFDVNTSLPIGEFTMSESKLLSLASVDSSGFTYIDDVVTFQGSSDNIDFVDKEDLDEVIGLDLNVLFKKTTIIDIPQINAAKESFVKIYIPENHNDVDLNLLPDVRLNNAMLSKGEVSFAVTPVEGVDFTHLELTVTDLMNNGVPISASGNSGVNPTTENITGYNLAPSVGGREIKIMYHGYIGVDLTKINPNTARLPLDITIKIVGAEVSRAVGYFGRQELTSIVHEIDLSGGSSMEFFKYIQEFSIADPEISMVVNSDVKIPILMRIDSLHAISMVDGERVRKSLKLRDQFNKNRFLINSGISKIVINNGIFEGKSDLSDVITTDLLALEVNLMPIVNPTVATDGIPEVTEENNEFGLEDKVTGDLLYSIPISGYFKNISITDTIDVSLNYSDYGVSEIAIALLSENSFPLDMTVDLFALGKDGESIELLEHKIEIPSVVDNINPSLGGVVPGLVDEENMQIITLGREISTALLDAEGIICKINASSMNPDNLEIMPKIKLYKGSSLKLKVVVGVKVDIALNN